MFSFFHLELLFFNSLLFYLKVFIAQRSKGSVNVGTLVGVDVVDGIGGLSKKFIKVDQNADNSSCCS